LAFAFYYSLSHSRPRSLSFAVTFDMLQKFPDRRHHRALGRDLHQDFTGHF